MLASSTMMTVERTPGRSAPWIRRIRRLGGVTLLVKH